MLIAGLSSCNHSGGSPAEEICLSCGLCCNGVIFADVQLQPGDGPARLKQLGLPLSVSRDNGPRNRTRNSQASLPRYKFPQPCAAFDGCRCRIYADRPDYCRKFECLLLKSVQAGKTERTSALRLIRSTLRRVDRVRRLLEKLGDTDERLPLSLRFRRTTTHLEEVGANRVTAHNFGKLTLAFHELNVALSQFFYRDL
jgi:Fe-S-cluster containining protein